MVHDPMSSLLPSTITGVLLAGGQSRRMFAASGQRGDKGLLDIAGSPMLAHVIERFAPQVGAMVINANGDPGRFAEFRLPVCADTVTGHAGPLAGVLAGMRWSAAHAPQSTHIATVSTDAPFLPPGLVTQLAGALSGTGVKIALARSGGELHPVIGLWPVTLAGDLESALYAGVRKVLAWTDQHGTVAVDFDFLTLGGRSVDPFFNANTPGELDEARALLASARQVHS